MSTEQCVRILVHRYMCSPIEIQIRLRGGHETISVICTLTISNKTVNFKLFNKVIFVQYAVQRVLVVPLAATGFWFVGWDIGQNLIHEFHSSPVLQWRRQNFGSGAWAEL